MKIQELDFNVNLLRALLWQYNEAASLTSLLQYKQDWYDINQTEFWESWITDVFDLRTANDFGLTVWAILLGIPLSVVLPPSPDKPTFGYEEFYVNYTRGNYGRDTGGDVPLTAEQKRLVLRLRYYQLVSRGNVPETNAMLLDIFAAYGDVWVLDTLQMEIIYVFDFALPSALEFVLNHYDILPRPAGVGVRYILTSDEAFGYGSYHLNYERGNYGA